MVDKKKVTIIGIGGIGSWLAEFLARAGVSVHLIDGDRVENKNLRYANYTYRDSASKKLKIDALNERISAVKIWGEVIISGRFTSVRGIPKYIEKVPLNGSDLVILCVDSIMTRIKLIDSLKKINSIKGVTLPWIDCRSSGRNYQIFTHKSKLTRAFLASRRTRRASCQPNIEEIQAGNFRCAAHATQIALDILRHEPYQAEVLEIETV